MISFSFVCPFIVFQLPYDDITCLLMDTVHSLIAFHFPPPKLNINIFKHILYAIIFTKHLSFVLEEYGLDIYREDEMFHDFMPLIYSNYCAPLSKNGNVVQNFVRGIQLTEVYFKVFNETVIVTTYKP